jgi:hypothetical protein
MDPIQVVTGLAIVGLGGWNAIKEYAEYRARRREKMFTSEKGLQPNPTRCAEHADAINEIRADVKRIKDHLGIV